MKIAVNMCYGGFDISEEAYEWFNKHNINYEYQYGDNFRITPALIACIEQLGTKAVSAWASEIGIATIPNEATDWRIEEYDGIETVWAIIDGKMYEFRGDYIEEE